MFMDDAAKTTGISLFETDIADPSFDDQLASKTLGGDESAFEQLFMRHRYRVSRIVSRFFSQSGRIEDITQDVFVKVYFSLSSYSGEKGSSFAAWISRVTINTCYDHLRRDRRRGEDSLDTITEEEALQLRTRLHNHSSQANAEQALISRDLARKLLARLKPEDRVVLALMEVDGLSVAEIAEFTAWSKSKVKIRAHRARNSLRNILKEFV